MKSHATDGSRRTIEAAIARLKPAFDAANRKPRGQPPVRDWEQPSGGVALAVHVTEREICAATGLHRATIRRMEARGDFPARRQLSPGRVGWPAREIEDWLASRPTSRA